MNKKYHKPIQTTLGTIFGRDANYLDKFDYNFERSELTLLGSINGHLSSSKIDKWIDYELRFSGVIAFINYNIDSWDYDSESSFDEVVNSDWMKILDQKVTPSHKHFLFQTYDDVIEIVCGTFQLTIKESS